MTEYYRQFAFVSSVVQALGVSFAMAPFIGVPE